MGAKRAKWALAGALASAAMVGATWAVPASAGDKVTICHIAGHAAPDNANEVTITISVNGLNGHFYENGTPKAGHEEDYFGPCGGTPPPV